LSPRLALGVAECTRYFLFEPRWLLVRHANSAGFQAPGLFLEWISRSRSNKCIAHHGAGEGGAAAEKGTAIKQPVSGYRFQCFPFSLGLIGMRLFHGLASCITVDRDSRTAIYFVPLLEMF
jgi:hypothetical protein